MFKWFVYSLILSNPTASMILLALFIIGVFSVMVGWPAYVFLAISVLTLIVYLIINNKLEKQSIYNKSCQELDEIEKRGRWIMGGLSFFALLGNVISFYVTLYSIENDSSSVTTMAAMAAFQFIFIGIPYLLMSLVRRKYSFWYGLMSSVILFGVIQFMVLCVMLKMKDPLIVRHVSWNYEILKGEWLIVCPLAATALMFFVDSLGKAFGFALKDENMTYGFDKEKHKYSIVRNNKLSFVGMAISFVWSLSLAGFCYYYMVTLW